MTNAYASVHGRSLASTLDVSVTGTVGLRVVSPEVV